MQEADEVRKLKAYAQAVLATLEAEPPANDPAVQRLFETIRSAAQETVRRAGSNLTPLLSLGGFAIDLSTPAGHRPRPIVTRPGPSGAGNATPRWTSRAWQRPASGPAPA